MRESMEDEGGSSAAVLGSCLGASVLSFVRECETHWRMGVVAIVVTLIAYHKLCLKQRSREKKKKKQMDRVTGGSLLLLEQFFFFGLNV